MNDFSIKYIMQISLILFSGIYSMSLFSHFGDKKHNNSIYPYISSIIILAFLPMANPFISSSEIGILCLYTLTILKLINSLLQTDNQIKLISILSVFLALIALFNFKSTNSINLITSIYGYLVFLLVILIDFIKKLKSDDFLSKLSSTLPIVAASVFIFLKDFSSLGYIVFIIFAVLDARKLYQDVKFTKSEFETRLEILEKDFTNELEKSVRKRTFYVERLKDRMAEVNRIDHLTKALNRKAITSTIDDLVMTSDVTHFVMLLFDIDKFKSINDTFGHVTGDVCLKNLATIAFKNIRNVDFLGRYGGDEFIILLPNQSLKEGLKVAERFRGKVSETNNPHFTISIGAAAYPWDGETMTELLSTADKGLYVSKENSRNRVSYDGYIKLEK